MTRQMQVTTAGILLACMDEVKDAGSMQKSDAKLMTCDRDSFVRHGKNDRAVPAAAAAAAASFEATWGSTWRVWDRRLAICSSPKTPPAYAGGKENSVDCTHMLFMIQKIDV